MTASPVVKLSNPVGVASHNRGLVRLFPIRPSSLLFESLHRPDHWGSKASLATQLAEGKKGKPEESNGWSKGKGWGTLAAPNISWPRGSTNRAGALGTELGPMALLRS